MMPLALSAALSFSMVLRPQVQVHRCHASPGVVSRHAPVLAQFGDFLKKDKANEDESESDEPVEYFFDPANAEEDDPDPSPPMAEEAAEPAFEEPAFDASSAAADAAGQASEAARGALASVQGAIAEAAAKA